MFFTYWSGDRPSSDQGSAALSAMETEWRREFNDFRVYDDSSVLPLLEQWGSGFSALFTRIRIPSCKSDIARLVLLWEFGGFYIDAHTGIGNREALSRLLREAIENDMLIFDMVYRHRGNGDIWIPNGAIYSRPRCSIVANLLTRIRANIERQYTKETRSNGYSPYNIAALTGAWIIATELFDLSCKPFRLIERSGEKLKVWSLVGNDADPIRFYRHYHYRAPGTHWSERQVIEPLLIESWDLNRRPTKFSNGIAEFEPIKWSASEMPSSVTYGKPFIYFLVHALAREMAPLPVRFLDVGAGLATYPKLFKKSLQNCRFTGIEVWSPYIEQFDLTYWYDQLIVADVRYLDWTKVPHFDIAFFGDVLEHMDRTEAAAAVAGAASTGGCIIASIPLGSHPQDAEFGNPWERHVSTNWQAEELSQVFCDVIGTHTHAFIGVSVICSNRGLRREVQRAYTTVSELIQSSFAQLEAVDPYDYASLTPVLEAMSDRMA